MSQSARDLSERTRAGYAAFNAGDTETLETLDLFVSMGLYANRSEAVRELMRLGLDSQQGLKGLGRLVKKVRDLDGSGKLDFTGLKLERESR